MKRKCVLLLLSSLLIFGLCSCSARITAVDELMRPPRLSGENSGIQEAFELATQNKTVQVKTPMAGEYRSAYVLYDFDADGTQEAITFYTDTKDETTAYMHVLDFNGTRWESVADINGKGSEVYQIDFCDMNGDGRQEIVVCWSLFESTGGRVLTVYTPSVDENTVSLRELAQEPFTQMLPTDVDADGRDEIFLMLITTEFGANHTVCRVLAMDDEFGIYAMDSLELVPALSVLSLQASNAQEGAAVVYADCVLNESIAVTEVVYWDAAAHCLRAPLTEDNRALVPQTARSASLPCMDVDADGVPEIPTQQFYSNAVTAVGNERQTLPLTVWLSFDGSKLQVTTSALMLSGASCAFQLTAAELQSLTVVYEPAAQICSFYRQLSDGTRGDLLFTLSVTSTVNWEKGENGARVFLAESGRRTYAYEITQAGEAFGVTPSGLLERFAVTR